MVREREGLVPTRPGMEFVHQPFQSNRLGDYLKGNFSGSWTHFRAAVAFVKRSGTRHIETALAAFSRIGHIEIIVGIDHRGTSSEGLQDLLDAVSPRGRVSVFHNRLPFTFHPKVYLFKSPTDADVIIGSGNLTEGGLFTNYEAAIRLCLDLAEPDQAAFLLSIEQVLDTWSDPAAGTSLVLDDLLLARLTAMGHTPSEALTAPEPGEDTRPVRAGSPFAARSEPRAPLVQGHPSESKASTMDMDVLAPAPVPKPYTAFGTTGFVMTLQRTDVGFGQTTPGTSPRSPEIFIPLAARDANPDFWNWPSGFVADPKKQGKHDRQGVRIRLGGAIIEVNMMTWPDKHDFRLRSKDLRSAGNVGDILHMEKVGPSAGYEYYVEMIPRGTSLHTVYLALCRQPVRNSQKKYGYY